MPYVIEQWGSMSAGEIRNVAIDYTDSLDSGELLTGTPTVTEVGTSDLTIDNKAVSTGSLTILGNTVATGAAVQFRVTATSGLSGVYAIRTTVSTDASPAQTLVADYKLQIR